MGHHNYSVSAEGVTPLCEGWGGGTIAKLLGWGGHPVRGNGLRVSSKPKLGDILDTGELVS